MQLDDGKSEGRGFYCAIGVVMWLETLEARRLMTVIPTADEQYMLELINRARANPSAEAARDSIDLNEGLSAGTISTAAKQPLAFNVDLITSARGHSQWMLDNQLFQHNGPGSTDPGTRMQQAGYNFNGTYGWGENIAWRGSTGTLDDDSITAQEHQDLFIDSGEPGRGHRVNIEDPSFKEIGVGIETGVFDGYNALMSTQDFGYTSGGSFLTGVAYTDAITADHFYEPGEGLGNITITATNTQNHAVYTTTTWSSGGYTLAVPSGSYSVTASGAGLGANGASNVVSDGTVTVGSLNVEADFTPSTTSSGGTAGGTAGTGGGSNNSTPPTAVLSAKSLNAVASSYTFTITYTGTTAISASTFDKNDLVITGPNGYRGKPTFISAVASSAGKVQKVTYRLSPPAKKWSALYDGVYHVYVRANQVEDMAGNFMPQTLLGYFKIRI
ncbi:MAG: carboxypeptidase regulatory-like domain-containing protein [Phycisphaerae bacterium]|nr:carboxypeptidase regulatory-like domain-containing protein [Phycisphaerae bacterium]